MNRFHRWYCATDRWTSRMSNEVLPWVLDGIDLSGDVLELGPGPGIVTEALLGHEPGRLTTLEVDSAASEHLRWRFGPDVFVETGDATEMPFEDDSFSAIVCCTMLHHVATAEAQDSVLREAYRVLRPGGVFVGSDSRTDLRFRLIHLFDVHNPIDPAGFADRLEAAGFRDVDVEAVKGRFRFRGWKPPMGIGTGTEPGGSA